MSVNSSLFLFSFFWWLFSLFTLFFMTTLEKAFKLGFSLMSFCYLLNINFHQVKRVKYIKKKIRLNIKKKVWRIKKICSRCLSCCLSNIKPSLRFTTENCLESLIKKVFLLFNWIALVIFIESIPWIDIKTLRLFKNKNKNVSKSLLIHLSRTLIS